MSSLFQVCRKSDDAIVNVYAVRDDKAGYPHFLVYENNEWKYVKAKHFYEDQEFSNHTGFYPIYSVPN